MTILYIIWHTSHGGREMTFGSAIELMKDGHKLARKGWSGKGIFVELISPEGVSKVTHPFFIIDTTRLQPQNPDAVKGRTPWLADQTDILATDWTIVVIS